MELTRVDVTNFLGLSKAVIEPAQPVVLVAGDNFAGKSSLYQAIRFALEDELPRIDLKRDAAQLVNNLAGKGRVAVNYVLQGDDAESAVCAIDLPSRARDGDNPLGRTAMLVTAPATFARMDRDARAVLVRQLSGVTMDAATVRDRLGKRGIPEAVVKEVSPLVVLGFEKCVAHAREQASQARGAWKQITGETYGAVKAASWRPPQAGPLPEAPANLTDAVQRHVDAAQRLLNAEALVAAHEQAEQRRRLDEALAPRVGELEEQIRSLRPAAEAAEPVRTMPCPCCNADLVVRDGQDGAYLAQYVADPDAPKVSKATIAKAKAALGTAERELVQARAAAARLASPVALDPKPTDEAVQELRDVTASALDLMNTITRREREYADAVRHADELKGKENAARERHLLVESWGEVEEAMGPSGIPAELMQEALAPLRSKLLSITSLLDEWALPAIADDCTITAGGRPYELLSESEQYVVDAIFAIAIADMTALRFVLFDRVDVLAPERRAAFVEFVCDMVDADVLDQAWLFSTMKARPSFGEDYPVQVVWLNRGAVA